MKGKRYTDEQITFALRQAEGGTPVADVCRQMGVSEASFYLWKKKYGKLGLTELRDAAGRRAHTQWAVVRRLQGRVPARQQQAVLLPAHRQRLPLPLPARLRRPRVHQVEVRLLRL